MSFDVFFSLHSSFYYAFVSESASAREETHWTRIDTHGTANIHHQCGFQSQRLCESTSESTAQHTHIRCPIKHTHTHTHKCTHTKKPQTNNKTAVVNTQHNNTHTQIRNCLGLTNLGSCSKLVRGRAMRREERERWNGQDPEGSLLNFDAPRYSCFVLCEWCCVCAKWTEPVFPSLARENSDCRCKRMVD